MFLHRFGAQKSCFVKFYHKFSILNTRACVLNLNCPSIPFFELFYLSVGSLLSKILHLHWQWFATISVNSNFSNWRLLIHRICFSLDVAQCQTLGLDFWPIRETSLKLTPGYLSRPWGLNQGPGLVWLKMFGPELGLWLLVY